MGRGVEVPKTSVELFCLTIPKNFVGEPYCLRKSLVLKNFLNKKGEGVSRFPVKVFLSHTSEKFRRGTF